MPKYGTVSQILLQPVVAYFPRAAKIPKIELLTPKIKNSKKMFPFVLTFNPKLLITKGAYWRAQLSSHAPF